MKGITNMRVHLLLLALSAVAIMSSCATPFGGRNTAIDWDAGTKPGTITFSDPKLYRREALIDERRKDVEWIDKLIEDSKTVVFTPEILREIETIAAISAALGLKFDPSSAVSYQRADEIGELKQQIDTMKLQLQLDQLKRDAELVRSKFEAQTEPVNSDLGKLSSDSSPTSVSSSLSATDQLKAAIDRLTTATHDFNKDVKGTAKTTKAAISPLDEFRDRQAYRDMLKAARNAASLDELHDWHGSALLRLNFQAAVIPDTDNSSTPGVIQVRVIPPEPGSALTNGFYRGWFDYLNRNLNIKVKEKWEPNSDLLQGGITNNFEIVHYLYAPNPGALDTGQCHGFVTADKLQEYPTACSSLVFLAPRFANTILGGRAYMSFSDDICLMLHDKDNTENLKDQKNRQLIVEYGKSLVDKCSYVDAPSPIIADDGSVRLTDSYKLQEALRDAKVRLAVGDYYLALEGIARDILRADQIDPPTYDVLEKVRDRTERARLLIETFVNTIMTYCSADERKSFYRDAPDVYLTPRAHQILWGDEPRVAIYEVGPREQVQRMSTVARAANSLELALSIAASAPGSGVAAEAAAGYSRQAMGRAEALERFPMVVGYSIGERKTFGWVLGPGATVDPKGKINLEQRLRSYDLTVDLSVPGWWPYFTLETLTAWAPDRAQMVKGDIVLEQAIEPARKIHVPMPANSVYASFATLLASEGFEPRREAKLPFDDVFATQKVSACRPATIVLRGDLLWRATTVIVGGVKIGGASISILPDMSGIIVDVPALDEKIIGSASTVQVSVLTPYGPGTTEVVYDKPTEGCKKAEARADPDGPSISDYQPKSFQLPGVVTLIVKGDKLKKVKQVTFGGIPGKIVSQEDKELSLEFPEDKTRVLVPSNAVILSFSYENAEKKTRTVEKTVAIVANMGGK
jgi:hypothetical protein